MGVDLIAENQNTLPASEVKSAGSKLIISIYITTSVYDRVILGRKKVNKREVGEKNICFPSFCWKKSWERKKKSTRDRVPRVIFVSKIFKKTTCREENGVCLLFCPHVIASHAGDIFFII